MTEATLRDGHKLMAWYQDATTRQKPVIRASEENLLLVFGAAERALEVGDSPAALFATLVSGGEWQRITQAQEERARQRLLRLQDQAGQKHQRMEGSEPRRLDEELGKLAKAAGVAT